MRQKITCTINGEKKTIYVRQATILLNMLRDELGLTGAKPGCKNGDCGTCTILKGNRPMKSCLMLAVEADGENFTTIEGLKDTPIQKAFLEKFAFQCGYCTYDFIMNCHALSILQPNQTALVIKKLKKRFWKYYKIGIAIVKRFKTIKCPIFVYVVYKIHASLMSAMMSIDYSEPLSYNKIVMGH